MLVLCRSLQPPDPLWCDVLYDTGLTIIGREQHASRGELVYIRSKKFTAWLPPASYTRALIRLAVAKPDTETSASDINYTEH